MRYRMKCWIAQANKAVRPYGFHIFQSDEGRLWAVHSRSNAEMNSLTLRYGGWAGSGVTITAPTLRALVAKIKRGPVA